MKLTTTFLTALFGLLIFTACGDGGQAEREALHKEVMALHDEVMPMMGGLRKTRKSIEALADSLVPDSVNAGRVDELRAIAKEISESNESMMAWMRQFEPEIMEDGTAHEEVMKYLNEQKKAISEVNNSMIESLKKGQDALK